MSDQTVNLHHKVKHVFKVQVQNNKYYRDNRLRHDIFTSNRKKLRGGGGKFIISCQFIGITNMYW